MIKNRYEVGRILVAIGFVGFGYLQFRYRDFVTGRPPAWPEGLPGQGIIAVLTGILFVAFGISIVAKKKVTALGVSAAIVIILGATLRDIYVVLSQLEYGGLLTNMGKALTFTGGALLLADLGRSDSESFFNKMARHGSLVARYFIGFFLFAAGVQHFLFAPFVKTLVPSWIPGDLFWTYFAGVALAAAGLGLLTGIQKQRAATLAGWMVFIWVLVLHIPRGFEYNNANEWIAVCEATAVSGILFVLSSAPGNKRN
jgi:uncharacterized membrane protein